ncbi:MAG: hypothetical protein ACYTXA_02595 [Nostoc sp.]
MRSLTMNQEKQERIKACLEELSTLLYEEADKSKLTESPAFTGGLQS